MTSVDSRDGPDAPHIQYTANAATILERSSEIAVRAKSEELMPKHVFLVALIGSKLELNDVENLQPSAEDHTMLWGAVCDIEEDPIRLAQATKKSILPDTPQESMISSLAVHPQVTAQTTGQLSRTRNGISKLLSPRRGHPAPEPTVASSSSSTTHVNGKPIASKELVKVIERAHQDQGTSGDSYVGPYHLIFALLGDESVQDLLNSQDILVSRLAAALKERKPSEKIIHPLDDEFPFLAKFTIDMTAQAREGKLDEIVGRDEEIRRVIQILCRRTKNSAVLIGEPGVGKTAVAEGLAHRIAQNQVPEHLKGTIYSLDMGALFAGAAKGEYEARVKGVIDDVMRSQQGSKPVILFIDELHLITVGKGSGGQSSGMDAANLLKPALARGQFRCIGATTLAEYREHIEKDGALERRFATVIVNEPSIEETNTILRGIRERYELHHNVWIKDEAIVTASTLAQRYLTTRRLPDSAVDLLDEACASARVSRDMKPEGIDSAEQELLHVQNRILALERDNHPADDAALETARKERESLTRKIKNLEQQQTKIVDWWKAIRIRRGVIRTLNTDLTVANGARPFDAQHIAKLQRQLDDARKGLLDMERQGPTVVHPGLDISGCTRTSPDTITAESIAAIVERATKIPVQRLLASDRSRLLDLEQNLRKQVIGQLHAVQAVANAIQLARTGLGNANRPVASLLFTGPSGTGKTLLSKALAQELFGQTAAMVRIDGSEYAQSHSISRLIGSPPGYVGWDQGGQLTEYVRRTPYCIVLLDEIEKTSPEFLTLFLQVLDEGRLTDGQGRLVDFRNCVIIMTSNVGSDILSQVQQEEIPEATREAVNNRFKERGFPVEFLNRVDEIVMFHPMSPFVMRQILDKHLHDLQQREGIRNIHLDLDDRAKTWLISQGISPEYGARPLARTIQRHLLNPLSHRLLEESVSDGDVVMVRVNEGNNGLVVQASRVWSHTAAADPQPAPSGSRHRDRIRRITRIGAS